MAIYRLIARGEFGPEEIEVMTAAYEAALADLRLDRSAPLTEALAKAIVSVTATGERNPARIAARAIKMVGTVPTIDFKNNTPKISPPGLA